MEQVRNTVPFIFEPTYLKKNPQDFLKTVTGFDVHSPTTPLEYFKLCVSAHHSSVASFVPTDVDNQIRFKLWNENASRPHTEAMVKLVLDSYHWDSRCVSTRWVQSPVSGEVLAGHSGEWFSTAAAAYAALRNRNAALKAEVSDLILFEVEKEARVYTQLRDARNGIGALKAATLIAHNLGDLDRVLDQWNVPEEDPLKQQVYKLGHASNGPLAEAGELNKRYMANENHRHFCLRAVKALRRAPELLLPLGPFFDDWGKTVSLHPLLTTDEKAEVVGALVQGWQKLEDNIGYARALRGILNAFPGGPTKLEKALPAKTARFLKEGHLRTLIAVDASRFEAQWNKFGLGHALVVKKT